MDEYEDDDIVYDEDTMTVKKLFADRDTAYVDATQEIVNRIGGTLLEALYELFDVPQEDVRWLDFQSTENLLIVICSISYNPSVLIPEFIALTRNNIQQVNGVIEQTVRVGIPYELVLAEPVEIVEFMESLIEQHQQGGPSLIEHVDHELSEVENIQVHHVSSPKPVDPDEFNPAELSTEQRRQLLIFQHHTKGKVH
jgi:hypothetical protein